MICINAQVADWIGLAVFRQQYIDNPVGWLYSEEMDMEGKRIEELTDFIKDDSYTIQADGVLSVVRLATDEMIEKEKQHAIKNMEWALSKIRKYMGSSEENKTQVMAYLEHNKIVLPL